MEQWFKAAFGVVFALLVGAAVPVARRLRSRPGGRVNQTDHELPRLRWIRGLLGIVFYGAVLDWLLPGTRLGLSRMPLGSEFRWAGAAVAVGGVLLIAWSFESLGRHYRGGVGLWDDHQLVTTGPYRRIRHPIYLGFIVTMAGIALLSADWIIATSGLLLTVSIPLLRLPNEEADLEERFGAAYREYRTRTGRFVPKI